jgi:hypothetical protein
MEPTCTCCGALTDGSGCDACATPHDGVRCAGCFPGDAPATDCSTEAG